MLKTLFNEGTDIILMILLVLFLFPLLTVYYVLLLFGDEGEFNRVKEKDNDEEASESSEYL